MSKRCTAHTFTQTSWTRIPYIGEWAIVLTFLGPDHILKERIDGALDYDQQGAMLILSDRPAGPISNISVHGPSCSYFHTDQLDQHPIYRRMGHRRDISWARPHPEDFHVLMLCTRHYKHTVRCTTASTSTCFLAALNGLRKSRLHGLERGSSILTQLVESLVKRIHCA